MEFIARATYQHARNLAFFTTLYKSICYLLQRIFGRRHPVQAFIAAFTCGYFVFGENNKVNMQVLVMGSEWASDSFTYRIVGKFKESNFRVFHSGLTNHENQTHEKSSRVRLRGGMAIVICDFFIPVCCWTSTGMSLFLYFKASSDTIASIICDSHAIFPSISRSFTSFWASRYMR